MKPQMSRRGFLRSAHAHGYSSDLHGIESNDELDTHTCEDLTYGFIAWGERKRNECLICRMNRVFIQAQRNLIADGCAIHGVELPVNASET